MTEYYSNGGMQKKALTCERMSREMPCLWCSTISTLLNSGSQVCVDAFCRRSARFQALQESLQILVAKFCGANSRSLQQLCSRHECLVICAYCLVNNYTRTVRSDHEWYACLLSKLESAVQIHIRVYEYIRVYILPLHVYLSSHCAGSARREASPPSWRSLTSRAKFLLYYCILHLSICP